MKTYKILSLIAIVYICSGCAAKYMPVSEWAKLTSIGPNNYSPVPTEVVFIARLVVETRLRQNAWPSDLAQIRGNAALDPSVTEFIHRNVEIVDDAPNPPRVKVWDLSLKKHELRFDQSGNVAIQSEVFGTGSRTRMHSADRSATKLLEAVFNGIR